MRRCRSLGSRAGVLLAAAALMFPAAPILARAHAPLNWPRVRSSSGWTVPIGPGVSYSRFTVITADGPLAIHHLVLDLNNPGVRLDVALAHDRLISDDETVSSMVRRSGAIAGVNADFFDIRESGMPLNIMVQNGRLLRSPSRRVALAIRPDRGVEIARYEWNGTVVNLATHASHWLAGFNTGFVPDGVVAITNVRGYGAQDGRRILLAEVDGRQPRVSIGLTQPELASYMRWLGAYQAMAFDSGGSVTMVARVPGARCPAS